MMVSERQSSLITLKDRFTSATEGWLRFSHIVAPRRNFRATMRSQMVIQMTMDLREHRHGFPRGHASQCARDTYPGWVRSAGSRMHARMSVMQPTVDSMPVHR